MSHKNNKNSKDNKKSGKKTKAELQKMRVETANEVGYSKESRKLGKDQPRPDSAQKIVQ
ncbi:MAG: small, acid-soluble spore protein, alpha/beta type [Clostridium sp.]|uniref:small, acid-soluble spore protein, alpha/beta type n=1 Tax=Clostridium sp. TaxID=1506 RepID=UPI0025BAF254|nr:small, acid-soluble spore protein, alpha/beta type [Clostridium sp.]MBS4958123.1 small, acid-soluble spore protein, alpha/beta type [Clostridium sp.]